MILGERPITRRRFAAGTYVAGKFVSGAITDTTVQASVQEATFKELQQLDEGERAMSPKVLLTEIDDWRVSEADGATEADHAIFDGATYKVRLVSSEHPLIGHFQVTVLKLKEPG